MLLKLNRRIRCRVTALVVEEAGMSTVEYSVVS